MLVPVMLVLSRMTRNFWEPLQKPIRDLSSLPFARKFDFFFPPNIDFLNTKILNLVDWAGRQGEQFHSGLQWSVVYEVESGYEGSLTRRVTRKGVMATS